MNFDTTSLLIAAIGGYLIGSIPFGLLLTRLGGYGDIRAIGSGNIGATNVLRTGNKKLALATLLLDGGKGAFAVLILWRLDRMFFHPLGFLNPSPGPAHSIALAAGLFAVIGHVFPVWLKFKGGKGVATALGTLLALAPWVGVGACAIWLATAFAFRYSSLAALTALLLSPVLAHFIYHDADLAAVCSFIALLVWFRHRANIKRLLAGEEPKIGGKKSTPLPELP